MSSLPLCYFAVNAVMSWFKLSISSSHLTRLVQPGSLSNATSSKLPQRWELLYWAIKKKYSKHQTEEKPTNQPQILPMFHRHVKAPSQSALPRAAWGEHQGQSRPLGWNITLIPWLRGKNCTGGAATSAQLTLCQRTGQEWTQDKNKNLNGLLKGTLDLKVWK